MTFSSSSTSLSTSEKLRMPDITSCSATWLPPDPQPATSTRAVAIAPTLKSRSILAKSLLSLIGRSRLRPLLGAAPDLVVPQPAPREAESRGGGMLARIPRTHHAEHAQRSICPPMRRDLGNRIGVDARTFVRIAVRQYYGDLVRSGLAGVPEAKCHLHGRRHRRPRLFAVARQFLQLVPHP